MTHTIDGNSVSGNGDWRTSAIPPQPQSVRTGMFPGIAQRFPIRDVVMPGGLIVEGTLRASGASVSAAITALNALTDSYGTMRSNGSLHTVVAHGDSYADVFLEDFQILSPIQRVAGGNIVQRVVRWVWLKTK